MPPPGGEDRVPRPRHPLRQGAYWNFFDHIVPLTARSLAEALEMAGFRPDEVIDRFLPFTLAGSRRPPPWLIRGYLRCGPCGGSSAGSSWWSPRSRDAGCGSAVRAGRPRGAMTAAVDLVSFDGTESCTGAVATPDRYRELRARLAGPGPAHDPGRGPELLPGVGRRRA